MHAPPSLHSQLPLSNLLDLVDELSESDVDMYSFRVDPFAAKRTAEHRVLWLGSSRGEEAFEARSAERVPARRGHGHSRVTIKLQETNWTLAGGQIFHALLHLCRYKYYKTANHWLKRSAPQCSPRCSLIPASYTSIRWHVRITYHVCDPPRVSPLAFVKTSYECCCQHRPDQVTLRLYCADYQQPRARPHLEEVEGVLYISPFQLQQVEEAELGCTGPSFSDGQCYHQAEESVRLVLCCATMTTEPHIIYQYQYQY